MNDALNQLLISWISRLIHTCLYLPRAVVFYFHFIWPSPSLFVLHLSFVSKHYHDFFHSENESPALSTSSRTSHRMVVSRGEIAKTPIYSKGKRNVFKVTLGLCLSTDPLLKTLIMSLERTGAEFPWGIASLWHLLCVCFEEKGEMWCCGYELCRVPDHA